MYIIDKIDFVCLPAPTRLNLYKENSKPKEIE